MNLEELKKLREEKFLAHKRKKRKYYLKRKEVVKKVYDYDTELNDENFKLKIKEIIKTKKIYLFNHQNSWNLSLFLISLLIFFLFLNT